MKYISYLLLVSLMLLGSCKTKNAILKDNGAIERQKEQALDNLKVNEPDIQTANFNNLQVEINANGNSFTTRASMKIIRDSIIQLSVLPVLGIEMARIEFTKSGFVAVDKINGRYFTEGYDFLLTKYNIPVSFYSLQALLLNRLFIAGGVPESSDAMLSKLTKSDYPDGYTLKTKPTQETTVGTEFVLNKDRYIRVASVVLPTSVFMCSYSEFTQKNEINFPFAYKISILSGPRKSEGIVSVQSVEFNKTVKINTTDLSNYEQVKTIEQIIP